jgi:hypothetical protein
MKLVIRNTKSGGVALSTPARPLAMNNSPQLISQNGKALCSTPCTIRATHIDRPAGIASPRQRAMPISTSAATAPRIATTLAGGIVSTAILINANEPPHSTDRTTSSAISVGR